ncbi:MAG: methyltransferase domain-containing protein [Myxococcales bacterium]|nr:MAG: methyltransferase domain-containing protein [Myxococcales bacterium]
MKTAAAPAQAWNASHYDEKAAFVPRLGADLVALLGAQPGERVLDLGCGSGDLTHGLTQSGAAVVGVDASPEMIEQARAKYPELELSVVDGQELPYDAAFDAVFSNAALHWMPRADAVAAGVFRALRPGGRFVAEFGGARNVQTVTGALAAELAARGLQAHRLPTWYFPTVGEYARVLEDAGLFVESAEWFERPTMLAGERGLSDWLELFCLPLLRALGPERDAVVAGAEARCRSRLYRDGSWWLDYARLRVAARKAC